MELIQLLDTEGENAGLYNVPHTLKGEDIQMIFTECENLAEQDGTDDTQARMDKILSYKYNIERVFVTEIQATHF